MSRYNGRWNLIKPFYDVFFLVIVVPVAVSVGLAVYTYWRLLRGHETAVAKVEWCLCETTSHDWADEDDYGLEPLCLKCGTERDRNG